MLPGMLLMLQRPRRSRVAPTGLFETEPIVSRFEKTSYLVVNFKSLKQKIEKNVGSKYPHFVMILSESLQGKIVGSRYLGIKWPQNRKLSTPSTDLSTDLLKI